ncbi:hypothetical protein CC86DRAFT_117046 [Ophiobolus disseminans]|uniref:Uncharacterized protein n=1 Tax=Ophiobolus disseminans TaxID=1469910 RepID=A0A6A6ZI08_9PLEO|nr:hypothetical protein CC86DRAFT_117046 [Ophiobolus disseminans]
MAELIYETPPGCRNLLPTEITPIKNLALSYIRGRYIDIQYVQPPPVRPIPAIVKVRIATSAGVYRRNRGTWKACCVLQVGKGIRVERGSPFAAFRPDPTPQDDPDVLTYSGVASSEWPSHLSPNTGETLDVSFHLQERPFLERGSERVTMIELKGYTTQDGKRMMELHGLKFGCIQAKMH